MNIELVLQQLDSLFADHKVYQVEDFLKGKIEEAAGEGDRNAVITLMNEIIGHFRETGEFDKSIEYCEQVLLLMKKMGMEGSVAYATTLLNVANAYRAAGLLRESMAAFQAVQSIYEGTISYHDFRYASLYNNMSLLFQEMGDFESACDCLERALGIATQYSNAEIEVAVTYTNLAVSQLKLGRYEEAIINLRRAFAIFERDENKDYHYSGALSAMGEAQYLAGNLEEAAAYYQLALDEIEKNVGRNKAYEITLQNLHAVTAQMKQPPVSRVFRNGMELCEAFYQEYGVPMIRTLFPMYESMIAVGLVGEGSECFGFDDEVSRDHDFGPGFCMWLTDQVYEEIGEKLQSAYDNLPSTYMGITRITTAKAGKRVGVFRISEFYEGLIGLNDIPTTQNQWLFLDDYRLATASNGKVFRDDLGEFCRIREGLLAYYPEEVRVKKIARQAALMAQSGQYNYSRMYGRGETVTAQIALSEFMKHTMAMVYLLNRRYAPFYKWMHKGMGQLYVLRDIRDILTALSRMPIGDDRISQTIELIVALIIAEMKKQGLTSGEDNYLDNHTDNILRSIPQKDREDDSFKAALVKELVALEWEAFDKVENEGGRADCQDDWNTFSVMRTSQYATWTEEMLRSYIHDFHVANNNGWNLIAEKYARMMESTTPTRYEQIKDSLPVLSPEKKEIINAIVEIQVKWMEEFAEKYPKAASNARSIHSEEDHPFNTSYETYLRGELGTYSDETLDLYGRFIAKLCSEEKNLAEMTMYQTAILYGYESLEDLENRL